MAHLVEWSMDPPHYEWTYDEDAQAIVATTTTVVRTYFYPSRIHEGVGPDVPLAPTDIPAAYLGQLLGHWDFPPEPLPDIEMEPMSPELLVAEPLPQPVIPVIDLSSTTTPRAAAASLSYLEYHPDTSEEDPFEERSSAASCASNQAKPSHRVCRIEVISRHPRIICTPYVSQGRGARETRHSRT